MQVAPPLLDSLSALADATRSRMLLLLDQHELTVTEICTVLQLPQSTVSRHLKTLSDAGWVTSRRDGTSRYYRLSLEGGDGAHAPIWDLARRQWSGQTAAAQDARRLARVLARRSETSLQFFATAAGRWDRLREELFGRDFAVRAVATLLPSDWTLADLGCGTGAMLAMVGRQVRHAIGVDASEEMLAAATARVGDLKNVDLRRGTLDALPIDAHSVDAALMMLVLHHVPAPAVAIAEAARVLKPGGRLLIVDMLPHDHEEYRLEMGHVWLGFSDEHMQRLLQQAGLGDIRVETLPPAADATGPGLFIATAVRPH